MPAARSFTTQITINASARRVYDAFVNPAAQVYWYTNDAHMNLQIGGRCQFEWNDRRQAYDEFWSLREIKTGKSLRFGWGNFGRFGGLQAQVAASFTPLGRHRMRLSLRHTVVRDPDWKVEDYKVRWRGGLAGLKEFVEV